MTKPTVDSTAETKLRQHAEKQLAANPKTLADKPEKLVHELQVHQIELEMQNWELRRIQAELEVSRARYFDLYDLAPVGYLTLSELGLILEANLSAAELLGVTRNALIKQPITHFILPADQDIYYLNYKQLIETKTKQVFDLRLFKHGSNDFWVRLEMNQANDADNTLAFRCVVSDINKQRANADYLRQAAALFETTREGVIVTDIDFRILVVNSAFTELTGYSAMEVIGKTTDILKSSHYDETFYAAQYAEIKNTGYWQGEVWHRRKNGEAYQQMQSISAVKNERGIVIHYVRVFSDISLLKSAVARLDYLAHHDPLTGLQNRLLLFSRMEHCIVCSKREYKSAALLMLDLDRFKDVNDSYGHLAGDELLQQVAERLKNRLRGIDTVTRLGGDEFAVLLEDLSHPRDAGFVASEIIQALCEPWFLSTGKVVHIGVSVGISLFPDNGNTSEELLQQADAALYRAKAEGRGNFKYFSEELTHAALRRISLESKLRRAMSGEKLQVFYQPQIEISSGTIIGAEVLLRWDDQTEGMIPPSQFIPIAEETGLISVLGEWVLREACRQGKRWIEVGLPPIKLAVNLSPHQFRHGDISVTVAKALNETGFPPQYLELELTESALMEREPEAVVIFRGLRALGISLAIDDFGTGYSSLAYLKRFPLNGLKIDKSFIDDIPEQEDDMEIAAAIIGMAHTLRLKVLAEGVETKEQLDFLIDKGCDYYQGFYKSPAVSADNFAVLLQGEKGMSPKQKRHIH